MDVFTEAPFPTGWKSVGMSAGLNMVLQLEIITPTVWFVVGIVQSELSRLSCLIVSHVFVHSVHNNVQEGRVT